jgi:methylmalonyl-CoA mutase N-terminal domain/subunit
MKDRFHARDPKSMMLRFHAQTAGSTLTAQQPINNVVRVALQALAAVLGGAQSLHTNGWDEALALPTEAAARLALRTQQIIAYETGVADTVDALGGSYHLERLTDGLEALAEGYLKKIDDLGGMVRAIEQGYPQHEIQDAAYQTQRAQETHAQVVVGVNRYQQAEPPITGLSSVDQAIEEEQRGRLKELRGSRGADEARRTLDALSVAAGQPKENLIPYIHEAVKAEASLGEIADALRKVFGEHREHVVL